jgi:hypothetical protein
MMERNGENFYPFLKGWSAIINAGCIIILVGIFLVGCSVESKLNRSYIGKSFIEVMDTMGAPTTVENRIGGGTIRSYVSKKMLKPAPINTGQFQYDKFESPKVMQTIVTSFIVDSSGKVLEITYSNEYSR